MLLTNDHCGDAADAAKDAQLTLVGVIEERRGAFALRAGDLDGYLVPKPAGATKGRQIGGQPAYVRSASAYLFRRR